MVKSILSSPQEAALTRALSASALRHKVLSNNIANVNTPGFKRSDVVFADRLAEAMGGGRLEMVRTNPRHLAGDADGAGDGASSIVTDTATSLRVDGNNVDIDAEMANVAENTIYYQAVAQQLGQYFSNLKSAIKEGRS